jgi:hypothetical protein
MREEASVVMGSSRFVRCLPSFRTTLAFGTVNVRRRCETNEDIENTKGLILVYHVRGWCISLQH